MLLSIPIDGPCRHNMQKIWPSGPIAQNSRPMSPAGHPTLPSQTFALPAADVDARELRIAPPQNTIKSRHANSKHQPHHKIQQNMINQFQPTSPGKSPSNPAPCDDEAESIDFYNSLADEFIAEIKNEFPQEYKAKLDDESKSLNSVLFIQRVNRLKRTNPEAEIILDTYQEQIDALSQHLNEQRNEAVDLEMEIKELRAKLQASEAEASAAKEEANDARELLVDHLQKRLFSDEDEPPKKKQRLN